MKSGNFWTKLYTCSFCGCRGKEFHQILLFCKTELVCLQSKARTSYSVITTGTDLTHRVIVSCCSATTWFFVMFSKLFYSSSSCSALSLYFSLPFAALPLVDDCFLLYQKEWDPKHGLPHAIAPPHQQIILPPSSHSLPQSQVKRFSLLKLTRLTAPKDLSPLFHLWFYPFQGMLFSCQHT